MSTIGRTRILWIAGALGLMTPAPARADLVLSELIVELQPGGHMREDLEVWNNSPERSFVAVEPREIIDPSLPTQNDRQDPDPEKLGLLVAPTRMIIDPGQRKLVRIASLPRDRDREHAYRVTIKPVVGGIEAKDSGLKILVGYDVLVLVRPPKPVPQVNAVRAGRKLTWRNDGNVSVELSDGRQCAGPTSGTCTDLPGKRLYPGATWTVDLKSDHAADYNVRSPAGIAKARY